MFEGDWFCSMYSYIKKIGAAERVWGGIATIKSGNISTISSDALDK